VNREVDGARATTRVVIVDDSEDIRTLLRLSLERHADFAVVGVAEDGAQGVQEVFDRQPDLVLLDVSMPVMDGLQALTRIREESPDAVVVMLSAFGEGSELAQTAMSLGAHAYIQKGGPLSELARQLRSVLDGGG
jgi:DNA-binding NarL/FixJ family response regulator